ncbi:uncharacterized protein [Procambarus clarkii]|uniref:uncharacterized protein n=1 Tax=Procambarus clarkii TaxID=6728 RepID=UPI001E67240F|nr:uncharacterized protein LOC123757538 [Procambarus clarkii]
MAERGRLQSLESLSRTKAVKLTLTALTNILLQEEQECSSSRERDRCKRKRSYSCGCDEKGELRLNKKVKVDGACHNFVTSKMRKRKLDDNESDETIHKYKRQKFHESFKNFDLNEEERLVNNFEERKSKDDTDISYKVTCNVMLTSLKQFFFNLSPKMWTDYGKSLIRETLRMIRLENLDKKHLNKVTEHVLCDKLLFFSTMEIENFSSDFEGVIYDRLRHCRKLLSLEITVIPRDERDVITATLSLQRLRNLRCLSLLPPTRYSFHWVIHALSQQCFNLRELKIVYNGDLFDPGRGVSCLQHCQNLGALWLFNFGRKSETKCVSELLRSLHNLKVLFHKELPNAILELTCDKGHSLEQTDVCSAASKWPVRQPSTMSCHLSMERVDLCWYQRAVGYQLVYVPSSYLLRVAQACPKIKLLNLVGPPCLAQVVANLPCLQAIILHQASLASCLKCSLKGVNLDKISELRVSDVWDVTHDIVSAIASRCPNLQVLSIINSSLEARGDLLTPQHRPAFQCLREVILVPTTLHGRPCLTSPSIWQLGAALTAYIFSGASSLISIHVQYKSEDIPDDDIPSEQDLEAALCCPRPGLRHLVLACPPVASPHLADVVIGACPTLTTLGSLATWPLTSHQCAALIASYHHQLDIT